MFSALVGVLNGFRLIAGGGWTAIDPSDGSVTLIGPTGVDSNFAQGLDFDNEAGVLYAWTYQGGGANQYGTIDLATGDLTPLSVTNPIGEWEGTVQNECVPPDLRRRLRERRHLGLERDGALTAPLLPPAGATSSDPAILRLDYPAESVAVYDPPFF